MFQHLVALVVALLAIVSTAFLISQLERSMPPGYAGFAGRARLVMSNLRYSEAGNLTFTQDEAERAAALLSIEPFEIHDVLAADDGTTLVKTTDGATYIIVPEDSPDHEGKFGVMFLVPPNPTYGGDFPVYVDPATDDVRSAIAGAPSFAESAQAVANLEQAEDDVVDELTGDELDEPGPKATPEEVATAEALVSETGANDGEPAPAPGPEHAEAVADATAQAADPAAEALAQAEEQAAKAGAPVAEGKAEKAESATRRRRS